MSCICDGATKRECVKLRKEHYNTQQFRIPTGNSAIAKARRTAILSESQLILSEKQVRQAAIAAVAGCLHLMRAAGVLADQKD